ncbi:MAG: hypothetical protein M3O70_09720 [Actinomycetota bacterium]|nr:hypothetical protein [Actinomycetota bacterium]
MSEAVEGTLAAAPASRREADEWLRLRAKRIIKAHLDTREDADFARSVKSMIDQTVHEYGGRFLFELIQNGYDEQARESDTGRLALVLARDEHDHGVLYVANTGSGFTASNVRAIANLGLSDKEIGKGIGNKGVGFKSVLQICEAPEVYSTLPGDVPGFCFRFALPEDIPNLVSDGPASVRQVLEEMSLYNVTVPVEGTPSRVADLWAEGYSTVIRLPLRSAAEALVIERLEELARSEVPVLLFLRRLSQVTVRVERGTGCEEEVLTRARERSPDLHPNLHCDVVALDESDRHLVFTQEVPPDAVADAVREAVENHQLDARWQKTTSTVEVSIAVPFDAPDAIEGRFYTYLPLGAKAPSPFAGHLNAPFSTNLARTDIDATNPLNRLLLHAAASLCLDAAEALTECGERPAECVLDLISWDAERASVLAEVAATRGLALTKCRLMPTRTPGRWTSMEEARRWPELHAGLLTAARASAACQVDFLPMLGRGRAQRLNAMLAALDLCADPSPEQLAIWTETIMAAMLREQCPLSEWDHAYADLALLFAQSPAALRSRRILLTDDWELRACASGSRAADTLGADEGTPFFPPARQRVDEEENFAPEAELDLPQSLKRRLFYLHSGLTWYVNRQQTPARSFLQDNRLVRRFDTRSIFDHIRGVLGHGRSRRVARDALRLVFNLTRSGATANVDLADLGLRVPAANGNWIPARDAMFSSGWPDTSGDELSLIAATPPERSEELHALSSRLLAAPSEFVRPTDDLSVWVGVLRRIGVTDLIALNELRDSRPVRGRDLTSRWLGDLPELPELVSTQWVEHLPGHSRAHYPDTPYKAASPVYWLPGQADWDSLTDNVRQAMCRQILRGLKKWADDIYFTSWNRDRSGDKNQQSVPTPLHAFLAITEWLPVQQSSTSVEEFVPPSRCWTFPIRGDETPPRYAALLSKRLRDLLDDDPAALRRLRRLGLGVWGEAEDSPQLVRHLGDLVARRAISDLYITQFRNTYQRAWAQCVKHPSPEPFPTAATSHLVVDMGGTTTPLVILPEGSEGKPLDVVVASTDDERSLVRLLADFRRPVLTVTANAAEDVTALLKERLGTQVVRATDVAPTVLVDGARFDPADAAGATPIADMVPALPLLIATLLEHRQGAFSHIGQRAFEEALDALRRVRLVPAHKIEVRLGPDTRPLPSRCQGVLSIPDRDYPALLVANGGDELEWATLDALAEPLMYLIGRPEFRTEFRLATTRMQAASVPLDALEDADLANACEITVDDVRTTARRIQSSMSPLLERLYPIVAHYGGVQAATLFDPDTSSLVGESDTNEALARIANKLPLAPGQLLRLALDASTLDGLRTSLGLSLTELNDTLIRLGGRYQPIDYSEQHSEDFADHIRRTRDRILDRIRWARWEHFTSYQPQSDWTTLRHLDAAVTCDPAWGVTVDSLTREAMDARIDAELERLLGADPPLTGPPLDPMDECAKKNTHLITTSIETLTETVRAWLTARGLPAEPPWTTPEAAARSLLDDLDAAGALDFAELGIDRTLRWLKVLGLWPPEMPLTIDLHDLGLRPDDIEAQRSQEALHRAEAAKARRTVHLDNQPFDLDSGLTAFATALDKSLDATPTFLTARNRFASLHDVPERRNGRRGSSGGSGGSTRQPRLSEAQREAVGFAGEWLAYKWLARHHDEHFSPACWVSEYRETIFPGSGDDGLGWDFEVRTRQGLLMYEVKTSQGEGGQIELGESQVLAAQQNARNGRWRLLVITDVLNSNRQLSMLRNPFDPKCRGQYTFVGQGLRLRYTPK